MKTMNTISKKRNHLRMRLFSLFFITILAATFSSCSKDDDNAPAPAPVPTVKDYLTSGKWYTQSATYMALTPCDRKTYFKFDAAGGVMAQTYSTVEGDCNNNPIQSGTYELTEDNSLSLYFTYSQTFKIMSINQDIMIAQITIAGNLEEIIFDKIED